MGYKPAPVGSPVSERTPPALVVPEPCVRLVGVAPIDPCHHVHVTDVLASSPAPVLFSIASLTMAQNSPKLDTGDTNAKSAAAPTLKPATQENVIVYK